MTILKTKRTYHGWILIEDGGRDMKDTISVEHGTGEQRKRIEMERHGNEGCVDAVAWWEKKLGRTIALLPTLKGCYRVYTEEEAGHEVS